ncbi:MAG: hypothetical protein ACTSQ8_26670 [Candidatus Helarchaeota archaeon]
MNLQEFNKLEEIVKNERNKSIANPYKSIDDLPLTPSQKECVIEYLAWKLWSILLDLDIQDGHSKSYDPLVIDEDVAHSYVFDMEDGGRHHSYKNLKHLEEMLYKETLEQIKDKNGFCEWKRTESRLQWISGCLLVCFDYNMDTNEFNFCPFCGKEIKWIDRKEQER